LSQSRLVIIGAGIVGLATGLEFLTRYSGANLIILEKEPEVARHQTGHNSGVIHSGIYYKPGSLKATLCRAGAGRMIDFCEEHQLPHRTLGKIIVATNPSEFPRLDELYRRGVANGIPNLKLLSPNAIRDLEPQATGLRGIHVPGVAVTDYRQVARQLASLIRQRGGEIRCNAGVVAIRETSSHVELRTAAEEVTGTFVINCAGLQSDYVARMAGGGDQVRIVPFRGEYYDVVPARKGLANGLIYPVPDPRFPFLGVHLTPRADRGLEAGPNAVFAFARSGYRTFDVDLRDLSNALTFPGFWKMAAKYWRSALAEYHRSFSKAAFVRALQKLVPDIRTTDLVRSGSGVRAQALSRDGVLIDDFLFERTRRILHVCNVPSPAATASLAIARELVSQISKANLSA
jgi:(S)-2-hydroxyglutarate dehydrogenase